MKNEQPFASWLSCAQNYTLNATGKLPEQFKGALVAKGVTYPSRLRYTTICLYFTEDGWLSVQTNCSNVPGEVDFVEARRFATFDKVVEDYLTTGHGRLGKASQEVVTRTLELAPQLATQLHRLHTV